MGLDCEYPNSCDCGCQDATVQASEACQAERARAEKYLDAMTDLTALRAKVREYLAAIDFDDDETAPPDLCEACQRTERAKAALRAEVEK
jgi:hypothetical protein